MIKVLQEYHQVTLVGNHMQTKYFQDGI